MGVEGKVSSEQFQETEASKKMASPKRPRRAAAAAANTGKVLFCIKII